jgi:signal transduction histidine kinase
MSIRLRLTLIYSAILALTLILFSLALYSIQAQYTINSLKADLLRNSDFLTQAVLRYSAHPERTMPEPPPMPIEKLAGEQDAMRWREREIVRVLDANGRLIASPFEGEQAALPLSSQGLQRLQNHQDWWETAFVEDQRLLIYNRPVLRDGELVYVAQTARPLTERDRSLAALGVTLIVAILLTSLAAFGTGWMMAGAALRPIHRITQTAQAIGNESDFTRRVNYHGPNDEIGQLATTFNLMLSRLQAAYQRVNQALSLQRGFVADVSHELRTPLTTVRGNLGLLQREPPLPREEQADILSDLVEESDRLIDLVNTLLRLARADAGISLTHIPFNLRLPLEEACRQVRQGDHRREIQTDIPDLIALGDPEILQQVLLALLDNAIKYSTGLIIVSATLDGAHVRISVRDSGPGIEPEILEHLFERFYRSPANRNIPGFGLGLPIARTLIEAQSGSITIESQPDGNTVWIRLLRG